MNWPLIITILAWLSLPVLCWGWAGGYVENKTSAISPMSGTLSGDFDYQARSDRLREWRRKAALRSLFFGSIAALVTLVFR